jgi:hypothetical protein
MVKILDLFEHRELRIPDRQQAFSRIQAGYIGLRFFAVTCTLASH